MKRLTVLLLAILGVVLAQGWMMQGSPMNSSMMGQGSFTSLHDEVADLLGVTSDELFALRQEGKTFAEITEELGVKLEDITTQLVKNRNDSIDQALANGSINNIQAERMKARSETVISSLLTKDVGVGVSTMPMNMPCPYHSQMMIGPGWNR